MALVVPGNGTIKNNTVEGLLLEAAMMCQALEANPLANPDKKNYVNVVINTDTKVAAITANLPIGYGQNSVGQILINATQYLETLEDAA